MESEPKPKTRLEELQEVIINSGAAIESEFGRTANDWLSCFGSRVFIIETYLDMKKVKELIAPEKHQEALLKLESLKERLHELKQKYPNKETVPPENIKQELLDSLDILE